MIELSEKQTILVANESDEYILVKKVDVQELMDQLNEQPTWATGMSWLTNQTGGRSPEWLREKMLYPYRKELEKIISYPKKSGEPWSFHIREVRNWLDDKPNFRKAHK